jgi:hypothetical protein
MISLISEVIRSAIETKLNNNTKNQVFAVGSYAYLEDKKADFVYNIRSGYNLIENNYIPVLMEFTSDYEPIPATLSGFATITLTFLLNSDTQAVFDNQLLATEEIVAKVVGNTETLTDGSKTYNTVWNMEALLPSGQTRPLNGDYYTQIATTLYVDFSDTYYYGNRYTYKLGASSSVMTAIKPFAGDLTRENTENYPHRIGDGEARGGNEESAWSSEMTVYVDSFLETNFLEKISSDSYDLSEKWYFQELVNGTVKNQFWVHVKVTTRPILLGEKQYITLSLFKSDYEE